MKTLIASAIMSATLVTGPAMALGISMGNLTRDLTFPTTSSEQPTKDKLKPGE